MANTAISKIKIKSSNDTITEYLIEPTVYATTNENAATATYTASLAKFELFNGALVTVRFATTNNANATLNINGTGAKPIYYNGAKLTASKLPALHLYPLVYDTSIDTDGGWRLVGDLDTNLVTGVKGNSETNYRTGDVNITKANIGLSNVENTKLSTWAGSANITTIGTLSSGTVPWARLSDVPAASTSAAGIIKIGTTGNDAAAGNHNHNTVYSAIHQTAWNWASDGTTPLSKYVTFDTNIAAGNAEKAPDAGWYNGFVSSHGDYVASFLLNKHRTDNWYVGWEQYPKNSSTTYTEPTWYLLAHSGNVGTGDNNGQIKIAGVNVGVKGLAALAYKGTLAWNEITQTGADNLPEGSSNWTDNTEILTSYASNNGFADTNAKGKVYRRDAITAWNYINNKAASVYAKLASNNTFTGTNTFTSTVTVPTPSNDTDAATKAYVDSILATNNAMTFKGTLGTGGTVTTLPDTHEAGDTYRVITPDTYPIVDSDGRYCEAGTLIICVADGTTEAPAHWTAVETNEDGAVIGPTSSTENSLAFFSSTSGRVLDDTGTYVKYLNHAITTINDKTFYQDGLLIAGVGKGAAGDLNSGVAGVISWGDPGPQIQFDSSGQKGSIIFTEYNTAGLDASWHFVTNQSNGANVTSTGFTAKKYLTVGQNTIATSYNLYNAGTQYQSGVLTAHNYIQFDRTGYGIYLKDSTGTSYAGVYDNGANLWVGATSSSGNHHKGSTYISTGYASDGVTGNKCAYISIPTKANDTVSHTVRRIATTPANNNPVGSNTKPVYADENGYLTAGLPVFVQNSTTITSTTDWDTLVTAGCYKVQMSAWGDAETYHSPNQAQSSLYSYGLLFVLRGNETDTEKRTLQIYFPHRTDNAHPIYCRMANGATPTWQSWHRLTRGNFDTSVLTSGTLPWGRGGTGATEHTQNRLVWSQSASAIQAGYHYASTTKIAVNSTIEPTTNFYVNGSSEVSGNSSTDTLTISSEALTSHIKFSRKNWNYITYPEHASSALAIGYSTGDSAVQQLVVQKTGLVRPGGNNTQNLGDSSHKWNTVYATTFNGNATSATTATKANLLAASTAENTTGLQYYSGQPTIGSEDGNAYDGSSNNYKLWSYPADYTAHTTVANIQTIRAYWGATYFHDIFMSPNNENLLHRSVLNGSAKDWRVILDSANYSSYALPKSGGKITGNLELISANANISNSANKRIHWYTVNSNGALDKEQAYIAASNDGKIGINSLSDIWLRPGNGTAMDTATYSIVLHQGTIYPYTTTQYNLGDASHEWSAIYTPILAAGSDSLTIKVGTASTTFTVAKFEGSAFLPGHTSARYIGSTTNLWTNTYSQIFTAGSRVSTTTPSEEQSIDRIVITPYYHTGGPWKIASADDSTSAYLKLVYGNTDALKIRDDGAFKNLWSLGVITAETGIISHICDAGGGTAGYFKFATIVVKSTYSNRGMQISYVGRERTGGTIYLQFSNQNGVDPALTVTSTGDGTIYYQKSATSTWDLYIDKSEKYDNEYFSILNPGEITRGLTWTWKNEIITTLPENYITASIHTLKLNINGNATTATTADYLTTIDVANSTIDSTAGSFAFKGSGNPWANTDWVGLQIGSNNDKWQLVAGGSGGNSLWFRQNDSGGTNTTWQAWHNIAHAATGSSIGGTKQPVYMAADGTITAGTALKNLAYKDSLAASDIPDISETYKTLGTSQFYGSENTSKFFSTRIKSDSSGWAWDIFRAYKSDKESSIAALSVYGTKNEMSYMYITALKNLTTLAYNDNGNIRIYPATAATIADGMRLATPKLTIGQYTAQTDGSLLYVSGDTTIATSGTATLTVQAAGTNTVTLVLDRAGSTAAGWRWQNASGTLRLQNNYTTSKGNYFNVVSYAYNTGNVTIEKGDLILKNDPSEAMHAATKQYVDNSFAANDAMIYKGVLNGASSNTNGGTLITTTGNKQGHTYKVGTAGYIMGEYCETGDMIICVTDCEAATTSNYSTVKANWTFVQTNLTNAVVTDTTGGENGYLAKFSAKSTLTKGPKIGTSTTTWLNEKGEWSTPTAANVGAATSGHTHGNITNGGGMTATGAALADGDTLLFVDSSETNKLIKQTSITFDGSTTTSALSKKGTWESTVTVSVAANDTSSTGTFPVMYAATNTNTTTAKNDTLKKSTGKLYFQPSTGTLTATKFSGDLSGTATNATNIRVSLNTNTKLYLLGTTSAPIDALIGVNLSACEDTGVYVTSTAGALSAVQHSYNVSGTEKAYTTYNTTDDSIDFIFI